MHFFLSCYYLALRLFWEYQNTNDQNATSTNENVHYWVLQIVQAMRLQNANMKKNSVSIIIGAMGAAKHVHARNSRILTPNSRFDLITNSEIYSTSKTLLVSRGDPGSAADSQTSPCSSPSALWLNEQIEGVSEEDLSNFLNWHVSTLAFAFKLFVEQGEDEEYFGLDGEYTSRVSSIHDQIQEFWSDTNVDDDIRLLGAHGSDLADRHTKLIPTLEAMFGGSYEDDYTVYDHATDIQDLITRLPGGYNFPLLTFNAFATDENDENEYPSIMMGDGYFEFQKSMGIGSEGPEYALSHEHAHHLQFTLGLSSQTARRQELMADALSAYFLSHATGGDMTGDELSNIHSIAYSVGDCAIYNDGHHGTPQQRR